MGSSRLEEQELTAELAAVKILPLVREGSGGEGREVRNGVVKARGRRGIWGQEEGREDIQKEGSYQRNEPGIFFLCTHGSLTSFPVSTQR